MTDMKRIIVMGTFSQLFYLYDVFVCTFGDYPNVTQIDGLLFLSFSKRNKTTIALVVTIVAFGN
ncbi:hypothetical protein BLOT_010722 [Blomia tropicalis]|nr:hypothetical protein BLOT_010722 [Blomia tropicalis]